MKETIKAILKKLGFSFLIKNYFAFRSFLVRFILALKYYAYNSFITNVPSYKIRTLFLKKILKIKIGEETSIHMGCFFAGNNINIGKNSVIARKCYLDGRAGTIEIGDNVSIAPECSIISMSHSIESPTFETVMKPVVLSNYAWLGSRVMIMAGVTVGEGGVAAAGAVVTKDIEAYTVVGGIPAKKIAERVKDLNYKLNYFPFFNTDIQ